jgi:hypothetical protein
MSNAKSSLRAASPENNAIDYGSVRSDQRAAEFQANQEFGLLLVQCRTMAEPLSCSSFEARYTAEPTAIGSGEITDAPALLILTPGLSLLLTAALVLPAHLDAGIDRRPDVATFVNLPEGSRLRPVASDFAIAERVGGESGYQRLQGHLFLRA